MRFDPLVFSPEGGLCVPHREPPPYRVSRFNLGDNGVLGEVLNPCFIQIIKNTSIFFLILNHYSKC